MFSLSYIYMYTSVPSSMNIFSSSLSVHSSIFTFLFLLLLAEEMAAVSNEIYVRGEPLDPASKCDQVRFVLFDLKPLHPASECDQVRFVLFDL